jgi:hypothetical protein
MASGQGRTRRDRPGGVKVYADHNVVAALVRQDQRPQENAATRVLKEWSDDGRITLVVSAVHDREDAPPEQYRPQRDEALPLFPKVEFADDRRLYGFNTMYGGPGGR